MLTISMVFALQFHVLNPKRFAVASVGDELPAFNPNASLNHIAPIWNFSLQCLLDDQKNGGRVLADAFGQAWGGHISHMEGTVLLGGWKHAPCPVLAIFLHRIALDHGSAISLLTDKTARAFATWLLNACEADSVVASNFAKKIQVEVQAAANQTQGGN